jgi:multidrug efflux system outer membrane protein
MANLLSSALRRIERSFSEYPISSSSRPEREAGVKIELSSRPEREARSGGTCIPKTLRRMAQTVSFTTLALLLSGCTVGPKFKQPAVDVPQVYRGGEVSNSTPAGAPANTASLGDEKWTEVFHDPVLQQLLQEAVANNYDVRIAAQRIVEQQDQIGITRSQEFPTLSGGGTYDAIGLPSGLINKLNSGNNSNGGSKKAQTNYYAGGVTLSAAWNLDFWGYYRQQTQAARDQLLSYEWARRLTLDTVVENVATAYFQLRTLDAELAITQQTVKAREQSLKLTQTLEQGGAGTLADVRQAEELLYQATAEIPDLERQIAQEEDGISILLGRNPGPIVRGNIDAMQWPAPEQVPAGLPSQLLERRPDIQQAEAQLLAYHANVRAARAQMFPQLSLSGQGGTSSSQLKGLFDGSNLYWLAIGSLTQTIFDGGHLRGEYHLSQAQEEQQVLTYKQTLQKAFQNVSDSLIALQRYREYREQEEKLTAAAEDATRLARMRYQGGSTSYLEVLTTDTNYYSAQLTLAAAREQEAISLVQLYSALGGGWK